MCNSIRHDERRKGRNILAIKTKARAVVGRGSESLLGDPGPELRLRRDRERKNCGDNRCDEQNQLLGGKK